MKIDHADMERQPVPDLAHFAFVLDLDRIHNIQGFVGGNQGHEDAGL